jgi:hypothetical protein
MAYVVCPRHGGQGAAAVCRHLLDAVLGGGRLAPVAELRVEYEGHSLGGIFYCPACAGRYGIPLEGLLLTGEAGLDRMFEWGWCPVCPLCLRDAGGPG